MGWLCGFFIIKTCSAWARRSRMTLYLLGGSVSVGSEATLLSSSAGSARLIHKTQSQSAQGRSLHTYRNSAHRVHTYRNGRSLCATFCSLPHSFSFHFNFSRLLYSSTERTWLCWQAWLVALPLTGFLMLPGKVCVKIYYNHAFGIIVVQYLIELCFFRSSCQV